LGGVIAATGLQVEVTIESAFKKGNPMPGDDFQPAIDEPDKPRLPVAPAEAPTDQQLMRTLRTERRHCWVATLTLPTQAEHEVVVREAELGRPPPGLITEALNAVADEGWEVLHVAEAPHSGGVGDGVAAIHYLLQRRWERASAVDRV
jgi:hypothetical protein